MSSLPRPSPGAFGFSSPPPKVRLVHAFDRPYENVVATARTCYSAKGIVTEDQASAKPDRRDAIAKSIYEAGHHTTFQHAHFQFSLENVSRQFLWTFLHSHPFYNSEQVSQRYVEMKKGNYAVPPMGAPEREIYERTARRQQDAYTRLGELLTPVAGERYFGLFPGRTRGDGRERFAGAIKKRAQEIARYVLPVATFSYLYHTVSGVTLFRYWRLCETMDAPAEQREVVGQMVAEVLAPRSALRDGAAGPAAARGDAGVRRVPVAAARAGLLEASSGRSSTRSSSGRVSRLVDWKANNEEVLASAVREILGVPRAALSDDDAIRMVLDPSKNRILGETLTLTTHDKLSRALFHPAYTFRKKLSHTADSQDQRHRMTPASRPALPAYLSEEPDYVVPMLVDDVPEAAELYRQTMEETLGGDRRAALPRRRRRVRRVPAAQRRRHPLHRVGGPARTSTTSSPCASATTRRRRSGARRSTRRCRSGTSTRASARGSCRPARCGISPKSAPSAPKASASAASSCGSRIRASTRGFCSPRAFS